MTWRVRAVLASAFVAVLFAGAALSPYFLAAGKAAPHAAAPQADSSSQAASGPEALVDRAFARVSGSVVADEGVPSGFAEEVCDLSALDPVQVRARGGVVGALVPLGEEEARTVLRAQFSARGWHAVSGAGAAGRGDTFERGEGRFRWAFVSCQAAASGTCVVVAVEEEQP